MLKLKKWMRPIMHAFDGLTQEQADEIAEKIDNYASHYGRFMFVIGLFCGWLFMVCWSFLLA